MSGSIRSLARAATFVLAGAALASLLMGPVIGRGSGGSEPAATTSTRTASCAGVNFYPDDDQDGFGSADRMRYRRSSTDGDGYYLCDPGLPHRAVVTKVQFTVRDIHSIHDINYCALIRTSLTAAAAGTYQVLAGSLGTTGRPGTVRLTDGSIQYATIDNTKYGYWLQCQIGGSDLGIGIYGANVTYQISSANG